MALNRTKDALASESAPVRTALHGWCGFEPLLRGPLLCADHWGATAVHELRDHVEDLARHLASAGLGAPRRVRPETLPRHALHRHPAV